MHELQDMSQSVVAHSSAPVELMFKITGMHLEL